MATVIGPCLKHWRQDEGPRESSNTKTRGHYTFTDLSGSVQGFEAHSGSVTPVRHA